MMQLKFTVEIQTGVFRMPRRGRFSGGPAKEQLLRVSGTPQQLTNFLNDLKSLPVHLGIRASFDKNQPHHSGVTIHSKVSFPVTGEFERALNKTIHQVASC